MRANDFPLAHFQNMSFILWADRDGISSAAFQIDDFFHVLVLPRNEELSSLLVWLYFFGEDDTDDRHTDALQCKMSSNEK